MGCDIHSLAERKSDSGHWVHVPGISPFGWRDYGVFAFLANVRNYHDIPALSEPRGIPADASPPVASEYNRWREGAYSMGWLTHSMGWLSLAELQAFDYDTELSIPAGSNGEWDERPTTFREYLGENYFEDLQQLAGSGAERIVFWFDN
jgi:hypothetical protein